MKSNFNAVISRLLESKLKGIADSEKDLTVLVCTEIYTKIFDSLVEIFEASKSGLTNEAMNYLAQQYYDAVLINGKYELNPNIFDKRAKLENIETKEIALLAVMLEGTDFTIPLITEIKRRS